MKFRSGTVTTTSTNVSTVGTEVNSINIVNRHSAVIYVKFYTQTVATFQDTPVMVVAVPATASVLTIPAPGKPLLGGGTGLCVRVTTGATDSDNTAAATLPIIELDYR